MFTREPAALAQDAEEGSGGCSEGTLENIFLVPVNKPLFVAAGTHKCISPKINT